MNPQPVVENQRFFCQHGCLTDKGSRRYFLFNRTFKDHYRKKHPEINYDNPTFLQSSKNAPKVVQRCAIYEDNCLHDLVFLIQGLSLDVLALKKKIDQHISK